MSRGAQTPEASGRGAGLEQSPLLDMPLADGAAGASEAGAKADALPVAASWPWSMWARMRKVGGEREAQFSDIADPGQHGLHHEMSGPSSRASARAGDLQGGNRCSAASALPGSYRACWPSLWSRVARCMRPLWDIYFVVALVVLYAMPEPVNPPAPPAWVFIMQYRSALIWIPFVYRFFTGFLHWVLSLVIMPGTILYMPEPMANWVPKSLQETINENNAARIKRRDELLAVTRGMPISLITPDGVQLDAVYWAGRGATRDGATVVRLNGNAEAFELQDDILPTMYCTRGINVLLFNYRGVAGSRWLPVCGSAGLGHLLGIWSVPAAAGLQLDAWTAVQFLLHHLQVPPEKVCVVGHSMGGAIAAEFLARRRHLKMAMCSSRSFAYMSGIAGHLAPLFLGVEQASRRGRFLMHLTGGLVMCSGWQHRSLDNFHRISGSKWIEFSTADHIIPTEMSLAAAVRGRHVKRFGVEQAGEECSELGHMHVGRGVLAGIKCVRLVGLDGLDIHNRLWVDEEIAHHIEVSRRLCARPAPHPRALCAAHSLQCVAAAACQGIRVAWQASCVCRVGGRQGVCA